MPIDLTPQRMKCPLGDCPSVHRLEDGRLEIRGEYKALHNREDDLGGETYEATIVIDPGLLENVLKCKCQAADSVKGEVPSLRSSSKWIAEAEQYYQALLTISTFPITSKSENMDAFNIQLLAQRAIERPMTGIFDSLTEEQKAGVLAYDGPEFIGGEHSGQTEEAGLPADGPTAEQREASLTPNSPPQEASAGQGEGLSGIIEPKDG